MRWNKIILVICLVIMLAWMTRPEKHMGIEFTGAANQYADFGDGTAAEGLTTKSISFWVLQTAYTSAAYVVSLAPISTNEFFSVVLNSISNGYIDFSVGWTTTNGVFRVASNVVTTNTLHHVVITYSGSATTNIPVVYVDGVSKTVTTISTPVGTQRTTGGTTLKVGAVSGGTSPTAKVFSLLIYNRILSQDEVTDFYNSRIAVPSWNGLIFAPVLDGAAGLQTYDGATLAAGNTLVDQVNGIIGTPAGSPKGYADIYLTYGQ